MEVLHCSGVECSPKVDVDRDEMNSRMVFSRL